MTVEIYEARITSIHTEIPDGYSTHVTGELCVEEKTISLPYLPSNYSQSAAVVRVLAFETVARSFLLG